MADITGNQTVRIRMPVGTAAEIDAAKKKGVFGFDTTAGTVAVCPADAANFVRLGLHPADAPAATSLNGTDLVLIVQGGVLKRTTVAAIGGGGVWQPLDSDLTAIAALSTTSFGRSLLTLADAPSARSAIGAASSADLAGYQPLDSDLTAIAALSTTAFGRSLLTQADAAAARTALGAGTSSFSGAYASLSSIPAAIDAIDGLTPAADRIPYYTGASAASLATLTSFARTLLDDADAATARGTLGAGTSSLTLGETSGTAFRGDQGKTAYDHSQIIGANPHGTDADDVGAFPTWYATGGVDFNGFTEPGAYRLNGTGWSNGWTGLSGAQQVALIQSHGGSGLKSQIATDLRFGGMLNRSQMSEYGNAWSPWYQLWDSGSLPAGVTGKAVLVAATSSAARTAMGAAKAVVMSSKYGNWDLDANTEYGIRQTSSGTLTLPAASAVYGGRSYTITATTALTLTISGTYCYLDAANNASYWFYMTSETHAFTMDGGHASGNRKKIEIWCDGQEWLVKC